MSRLRYIQVLGLGQLNFIFIFVMGNRGHRGTGIVERAQVCYILVEFCCIFGLSIIVEYDTFYKQASVVLSSQQEQY